MKLQKLIMGHISMAGAEPFLITFSMIQLSLANAELSEGRAVG